MRILVVLSGLILASIAGPSNAATKSVTWVDSNFVPCEGMGAAATGRIDVDVDYTLLAGDVRISGLRVATSYTFTHSASGTITYRDPSGASRTVRLQKPWFDAMDRSGSPRSYLYLPRKSGAGGSASPSQQEALLTKAGTDVSIDLSTAFPQSGGSCFSSFSHALVLP